MSQRQLSDLYFYRFERDKPVALKVGGVLAAIFGVGGLVTSPVFGVIMVVVGFGLLAYQTGIEVDFAQRRYRMVTIFGPQRFGDWLPLPEMTCVSVFRTTIVSSTYGRSSASVTQRDQVTQVNLATVDNRRIRLLEVEDSTEAFAFAQLVATKTGLRIWDATGKEGRWMGEG